MTSSWTWQIFVMSHKHETLFSLLDSQEDLLGPLSTTGAADSQNTNIYLFTYTTPLWYQGKEVAQKTLILLFPSLTFPPLSGADSQQSMDIQVFQISSVLGLKQMLLSLSEPWNNWFDCLKVKGNAFLLQHEHAPRPPSPISCSRTSELWSPSGCSSEESTAGFILLWLTQHRPTAWPGRTLHASQVLIHDFIAQNVQDLPPEKLLHPSHRRRITSQSKTDQWGTHLDWGHQVTLPAYFMQWLQCQVLL